MHKSLFSTKVLKAMCGSGWSREKGEDVAHCLLLSSFVVLFLSDSKERKSLKNKKERTQENLIAKPPKLAGGFREQEKHLKIPLTHFIELTKFQDPFKHLL